jgi:hypothetical protein
LAGFDPTTEVNAALFMMIATDFILQDRNGTEQLTTGWDKIVIDQHKHVSRKRILLQRCSKVS